MRQVVTRTLTLSGHESFSKVPTTDAFALAGVPFFRIGARTNDAGAGLEARLTRTALLQLDYTFTSVDFESARLLAAPGWRLCAPGICAFEQKLSRPFTLGARYQQRRAVLAEGNDRVTMQDAAITAQYELTPHTELSGFAGVARLEGGAEDREETGPSLGINLSRQLTRPPSSRLVISAPSFPHGPLAARFRPGIVRNRSRAVRAQSRVCRGSWHVLRRRSARPRSAESPLPLDRRGDRISSTRWLRLEGYFDGSGRNEPTRRKSPPQHPRLPDRHRQTDQTG